MNDFRLDGFSDVEKKNGEIERKRQSFRMFFSDYETLLKLRNFKIIKEHQVDFTLADGIAEGINLLADKYNVVRGQKKTKFRIGRRNGVDVEQEEIKNTSANLLIADIDLMSDILYHKTNVIGEVDYTVMQFVRELALELDKKYKGKL